MKIRKGKFTGHFFANANAPIPPDIIHRIRGYFPILEAQMDTTEQRFVARNQIYSDGVRILYSIIKNGPLPIYKVDVYIPPVVQEATSILMISGLFDIRTTLPVDQDGNVNSAVFLSKDAQQSWQRSDWTANERLAGSFSNAGADNCEPSNQEPRGGLTSAYSSNYSGEMRRVVQMLHGMCQTSDGKTPDGTTSPVVYNSCWSVTHGIFVAANGDRWVVEVSATDGVSAWRLPVSMSGLDATAQAGLGIDVPYLPAVITALPAAGDRVSLMSAADMVDFAETQAYFEACGWAFSADGHKAVNTSWSWPDTYKRFHRWSIAIDEVGNAPVSATITEEETGYLWVPDFAVKVPDYQGGIPTLTLLDLSYGETSPGSWSDIPIHVYFHEGENDTPVIWSISQATAYSSADRDPTGFTPGYCGFPGLPLEGDGKTYHHGGTRSYAVTYYVTASGGPSPEPVVQSWSSSGITIRTFSWYQPQFSNHYESSVNQVYTDLWIGNCYQWNNVPASSSWGNALILPFFERCCAIVYSGVWEVVTGTKTRSQYRMSFYMGDYYYPAVTTFATATWDCDCNITGQPIGVQTPDSTYGTRSTLYLASFGFTALEDPVSDGTYKRWCFDSTQNPGGSTCEAKAEDQTPVACTSPVDSQSIVDGVVISKRKLHFFGPDNAKTVLIDDDEYNPLNSYEGDVSPDAQLMDARLDAFSGAGSVSAKMDGIAAADRALIGGPDAYYPMADIQTWRFGWFGSPLPELL